VLALASAALAVRAVVRRPADAPHGQRTFVIAGNLRGPLWPGSSQRLNLRLTNRTRYRLWITRLRIGVSVDRAHGRAGCSPRRDFAVRQLERRAYPFALERHSRRRLSSLGIRRLPRVAMRNLAHVNQDACKGARLRLRYRGLARRGPRPHVAGSP
jgi:hypothetical protein